MQGMFRAVDGGIATALGLGKNDVWKGKLGLYGASRALVLPGGGGEVERGRPCYIVTSSLGTRPIFLPHLLPHMLHLLLASPPLTSKC